VTIKEPSHGKQKRTGYNQRKRPPFEKVVAHFIPADAHELFLLTSRARPASEPIDRLLTGSAGSTNLRSPSRE
jgi:hypothetical protein